MTNKRHPMVKQAVGDMLRICMFMKLRFMLPGGATVENAKKMADEISQTGEFAIPLRYIGAMGFHGLLTDELIMDYLSDIRQRAKALVADMQINPQDYDEKKGYKTLLDLFHKAIKNYTEELVSKGFDPDQQPKMGSGNPDAQAVIQKVAHGA